MIKTITIILLFLSIKGCHSQEARYYVIDIIDDNCIESYYRLKLKKIDNDSIFQVLSLKEISDGIEVKVADVIKITIQSVERKDWNLKSGMRQDKYVFYCDGNKILEEEECFYKSEDLKGLTLVKK